MMRPTTSIGPPAAKGTTMVTGRVGQICVGEVCASAGSASTVKNAAAKIGQNIALPSLSVAPEGSYAKSRPAKQLAATKEAANRPPLRHSIRVRATPLFL